MTAPASPSRRFAIHGLMVDVSCHAPGLAEQIDGLLSVFAAQGACTPFAPTCGTIAPYRQGDVLPHLSPTAAPLSNSHDLVELYHERERFWLVDERWGLAEMNLLRGQWRSWVLPHVRLAPRELAENAVLWPLAQLLRGKGLHLLPVASVVRDGWAVLIVCPFSMEPELRALVRAGYRLIGQRWTAVRDEGPQLKLLHMPGQVQRLTGARSAGAAVRCWVDLTSEYCGAEQRQAACNAVVIIEPGRRAAARLSELPEAMATTALRGAWPIVELHPQRRHGQLAARLVHNCRCASVQLSRRPEDFLGVLDRLHRPYASRVAVHIRPKAAASSAPVSAPAPTRPQPDPVAA